MAKLRWTLLILGGLFVIVLALWEKLRPRQASPRERGVSAPRVAEPTLVSAGTPQAAAREPWIGEAGLDEAARLGDPPAVLIETKAPAAADESPTAELPVLSEPAVDIPGAQVEPEFESDFAEGVGTVRVLEADPRQAAAPVEPIVEWPPDDSRHIVALRLVAATERFPGRAVRQALAAEGFRLGKFDIFHKPDEAHRAVVSAASLTRPGTFELETMDLQRYAGLNLFVVLPGPRAGQQAVDELVDVAHNLCERLQGELQDAQGAALTGESLEALRAGVPASAAGGTA